LFGTKHDFKFSVNISSAGQRQSPRPSQQTISQLIVPTVPNYGTNITDFPNSVNCSYPPTLPTEPTVNASPAPGVICDEKKCGVAKCPIKGPPKYRCAMEGCSRYCHVIFHNGAIVNKYCTLKPLPTLDGGECAVACCKLHHEKAYAALCPEDSCNDMRNTWDKDGKGGKDDPHTSLQILTDWWTTVPNYEKYRGKNNNGTVCGGTCTEDED
jgi:hypothetical protein